MREKSIFALCHKNKFCGRVKSMRTNNLQDFTLKYLRNAKI